MRSILGGIDLPLTPRVGRKGSTFDNPLEPIPKTHHVVGRPNKGEVAPTNPEARFEIEDGSKSVHLSTSYDGNPEDEPFVPLLYFEPHGGRRWGEGGNPTKGEKEARVHVETPSCFRGFGVWGGMKVRLKIRQGAETWEEEAEVKGSTSYDALGASKDLIRDRYAHLKVDERPVLLSVLPLPTPTPSKKRGPTR